MVRLEGLGKLKKKTMTLPELKPGAFRIVALRLNHLHYRVYVRLF
jgi:hypothetical protein